MTVGLVICAAITVLTTAGIILVLGVQSFEFFSHGRESASPSSSSAPTLKPDADPPKFGIVPLDLGDVPGRRRLVADRAADRALERDLSERVRPAAVRAVLKPTLELLAGIPTIVYGYLALLLVTPVLKRLLEPLGLTRRDVQRARAPASWSA